MTWITSHWRNKLFWTIWRPNYSLFRSPLYIIHPWPLTSLLDSCIGCFDLSTKLSGQPITDVFRSTPPEGIWLNKLLFISGSSLDRVIISGSGRVRLELSCSDLECDEQLRSCLLGSISTTLVSDSEEYLDLEPDWRTLRDDLGLSRPLYTSWLEAIWAAIFFKLINPDGLNRSSCFGRKEAKLITRPTFMLTL